MTRTLLFLTLILALAIPASALPPLTTSILGNGDEVDLRLGYQPTPSSELGAELAWVDNTTDRDAYGASIYGLWNIIDKLDIPVVLPFGAGAASLRLSTYLGGKIGFLSFATEPDRTQDATAAGLLGTYLGDSRFRIGLEWQGVITKDMWAIMADSPESKLLLNLAYIW